MSIKLENASIYRYSPKTVRWMAKPMRLSEKHPARALFTGGTEPQIYVRSTRNDVFLKTIWVR